MKKLKGKTMEEFIEWLEEVLIPDLEESGRTHTAQDFETCIKWLNHLSKDNHKLINRVTALQLREQIRTRKEKKP